MIDRLGSRFEEHRPHLRTVAYRMLGSFDDADDAVQDAWLRLNRHDDGDIDNIGGWLTTVVSRICLDLLRVRRSKAVEPLEPALPDFLVSRDANPEDEAVAGDTLGLAATIVLEALSPAERVAFVLHDGFAMPFEEIAPIVDRSEMATRQLASRARRRVHAAEPPATPFAQRRAVVARFVQAARDGNVEELLAVLDPEIVLRADREPALRGIRGAKSVASQASSFARVVVSMEPVVVNGSPGILAWLSDGKPLSVMGFVVDGERIRQMYVLSQPERFRHILAPAYVSQS